MAQYKKIKADYEDAILMYRLGDFYEMFFDDAIEASKILQITLTSRNKNSENQVPMCGVPFHAVNNYIAKLTRAGKKIALCDQITEPDGKGIVERDVVRIITPGTTLDENVLEHKRNNYVAYIISLKNEFGLAYADITTGFFNVTTFGSKIELLNEIERIQPAEILIPEVLLSDAEINGFIAERKFFKFSYNFNEDGQSFLLEYFSIKNLECFGISENKAAIKASAGLLTYIQETQKCKSNHINSIKFYKNGNFMPLDENTLRNLEIFYTQKEGKSEGSLFAVIDETVTSMGGRLLRRWMLSPLINKKQIDERLNKVEAVKNSPITMRNIRELLSGICDIERLIGKISLGSGNARDIKVLEESFRSIPELKMEMAKISALEGINSIIDPLGSLFEYVNQAIKEDAPFSTREGNMIKSGFCEELDELRKLMDSGKRYILEMQEREVKRTGITTLKIRFNKVFGYYIEVSKANAGAVPEDYHRKQTLVNAERFITPELKEYEEKVLNAESRICELEYELFHKVRMEIIKNLKTIQSTAAAIANLDVIVCFAHIAEKYSYVRPEISEENIIDIVDGRHPVIEKISGNQIFVPNNCYFDDGLTCQLITGPNMGGKSTYLRQTAIIAYLSQIGCFVPARSAKIGIRDRIFTRVGASDNLSKGQSTFMVEMQETAYILHNATVKSLVILDEVGRGTSTYDGVSIAWSLLEFMHNKIKGFTLFATHYHELIELADNLSNAKNLHVLIGENEDREVVFLYKVLEGGVNKSYGLEVAKLAGLPVEILLRARQVLKELENKHIRGKTVDENQLSIFEEKREHQKIDQSIFEEIRELDLNNLTPLQAMLKLEEIKLKTG